MTMKPKKIIARRVPAELLPERGTDAHKRAVTANLAGMAQDRPLQGALQMWQDAMLTSPLSDPTQRTQRLRYSMLETRMEMAATVLSAGGTIIEAAEKAGVSPATVNRYLTDESFVTRVNEQRALVRARVGGRIEAWMERRTEDPRKLDEMDPRTTLAIYDRIAPVAARGVHAEQTNVTVNNYPDFMGRLAHVGSQRSVTPSVDVDDAGAQGSGFPIVGSDSPPVAG